MVQLNSRRIRQFKVAATEIEPYYERPHELRLQFDDPFVHLVQNGRPAMNSPRRPLS